MIIEKELRDISWLVDEPTYRADPALSYSTLSTYESLGFNGLDHLFDRKESASLSFGSAVDCYLTAGEQEFNDTYFVADFPSLGDKELQAVTEVHKLYGHAYKELIDVPSSYILNVLNTMGYQKNWKDETRVRVLTEKCSEYYGLMSEAKGKEILNVDTYNDVLNCVKALKESPATCGYFADDDMFSPVRRYYQLKFKFTFNGVPYRSMADLICVNYEKKIVYPIDLKTSSNREWDFENSFLQWHYVIQSRIYWANIRANMDNDPYFKDFELDDYRFIVVNRWSKTPLVWKFPLTKVRGTLVDAKGNEIRDPFDIGKELYSYLQCRPPVPYGINMDGDNIINCLRIKETDEKKNQGCEA